jgi:hypothetical protein
MAGSRPWSVTCSMTMFLAKLPEKRRFLISLAVLGPMAASLEPCFVTIERERHADGDRRELIEFTLTASVR